MREVRKYRGYNIRCEKTPRKHLAKHNMDIHPQTTLDKGYREGREEEQEDGL